MKLALSSFLVAVTLAMAPMASVQAKQAPPPPSVKADTKDQFATLANDVRAQMEPGGRFEFVDPGERSTVEKNLGQMQALFDKFGSVDAMDTPSKIQLYNDQSEVNAILTRRDGNREVCERAPPLGTLIPKTTCRKYSDIERDRRDAMKMKEDMLHTVNPQPSH